MRGPDQLGREPGGLGCWAEQQCGLEWEKAGTPVTVIVLAPSGAAPLGGSSARPSPELGDLGVAALPAHLVQRASFWPCDRGRTGTRRPAEMRAAFPGVPGRPARVPASCLPQAASMQHPAMSLRRPRAGAQLWGPAAQPCSPLDDGGAWKRPAPRAAMVPLGGPWLLGKH